MTARAPSLRPRLLAVAALITSFLLDLWLKHLALSHAASWNGRVWIPALLDARYEWNRGISFSLFWQHGDAGSLFLSLAMLAICVVLIVAAWRTRRSWTAIGLGLIVGGALGNVLDRFLHGGVFDFLAWHLGRMPLFVNNPADILISLGALVLGLDALLGPKPVNG